METMQADFIGGAVETTGRRDRRGQGPKRPATSAAERAAKYGEALSSACNNRSLANYPAIYAGFEAMGIPESEILPRVNVFTFNAWKALGRKVRKGEHGVKVVTWIPIKTSGKDAASGEDTESVITRPWTTTVFHVSQTEPIPGAVVVAD